MARRDVIEVQINKLGSHFGDYVQVYDDRVPFTGEQLAAHRRSVELRRQAGSVRAAVQDEEFVASLRRTLRQSVTPASWSTTPRSAQHDHRSRSAPGPRCTIGCRMGRHHGMAPSVAARTGITYSALTIVLTSAGITEVAAEGPGHRLKIYFNSDGTKDWPTSQIVGLNTTCSAPAIVCNPGILTEAVAQR